MREATQLTFLTDAELQAARHPLEGAHFILDCDGVLLDWAGGFARWLDREKGLPVDPKGPCSYDMVTWTGAKNWSQVQEWITDFNESPAFATLSTCFSAIVGVHQMVSAGARVSVVTSCGDHNAVPEARRYNLTRNFGDVFEQIICLPLTGSKINTLAGLATPGRSIWVEDNLGHAIDGMLVGCEAYMIRHRHNRDQEKTSPEPIRWAENLEGVFSHACKITENVKV